MHIRSLTRLHPAPASNIQEGLDIVTYMLNIIKQVMTITSDLQSKSQ